ncbi:hypothetical protein VTI74DRAFT_482 [Chaetomium olivicolor]
MNSASLISHLRSVVPHDGSRDSLINSVLPKLLQSIADTAHALRNSHHIAAAGTANSFGDHQLNVDVAAENLIRQAVANCPSIVTASSEEDPIERRVQHSTPSSPFSTSEKYTIAFDPLDGSSIIPANWTVGTIISLWDGSSALNQSPAHNQIAAILGMYGPRTTAIIALRLPQIGDAPIQTCFELSLDSNTTTWIVTRPRVHLTRTSRFFSPANLRAAAQDKAYMSLVADYIAKQYTLRYAGGLVPDVVHMLVQGQGVYLSPVTEKSKAKLRRLYELCPLALVVECAGGSAVDPGEGGEVLGRVVRDCGETGGLLCGSAEEVASAAKRLVDLGPRREDF